MKTLPLDELNFNLNEQNRKQEKKIAIQWLQQDLNPQPLSS